MPQNLNLDYYLFGIPSILFAVALILYAQILLKRRLGAESIRKCHEVGGYYLSLVGTFYAVLLGLIVVDAMNKFQHAENTVDKEATALLKIFSSSERFPESHQAIANLVRAYTDEVLNREIPRMAYGETSNMARKTGFKLLKTIKSIEPVTENQKAIYPSLLAEVSDFWDARRERLSNANFGEPTIEWVMLLLGALITVVFTFFFTIESHGIHLLMRGMATMIIFMSLYLTFLFASPFSGDLRVSTEPFRWIENYADSEAMEPPPAPAPTAPAESVTPVQKPRPASPGPKSDGRR
jgi:Protein of unknown function (DUF4239)